MIPAAVALRKAPTAAATATRAAKLTVLSLGSMIAGLAFIAGGTQNAAAGGCAPGADVPASTDLDPATLDRINALKTLYFEVGMAEDVPWTALAAIDYRESNNDPVRSALAGEALGAPNPDHPEVVTTTKRDSLVRAAEYLRGLAASVYGVSVTAETSGEDLAWAFLAYNRGYIYDRANVAWDLSPYVANQLDGDHLDMTWPDIAGEPLAGRTEYARYGALVVFSRLGGEVFAACGTVSDLEVVAIAQGEVGKREIPNGCNCGPEIAPYLGSSAAEPWCADFISWVYREAGSPFTVGVDGGWRVPAVITLQNMLRDQGTWVPSGDGVLPSPGDIIIFDDDEHAGIVEKVEGDRIYTIEGNSSNAVSRRSYPASYPIITGWGSYGGVTA